MAELIVSSHLTISA